MAKCNNNITVASLPTCDGVDENDYLIVYNNDNTCKVRFSDFVFGAENVDFYPDLINIISTLESLSSVVIPGSGDWNSVYSTVQTNSGGWNSINTGDVPTLLQRVREEADDWSDTNTALQASSAGWDDTSALVDQKYLTWDRIATEFDTSKGDWNSAYNATRGGIQAIHEALAMIEQQPWYQYLTIDTGDSGGSGGSGGSGVNYAAFNELYTTVQYNSAGWDNSGDITTLSTRVGDLEQNLSTGYLPLQGGSVSGQVNISDDLYVTGDIHTTGDLYVNKDSIVFSDDEKWSSTDSKDAREVITNYTTLSAAFNNTTQIVNQNNTTWDQASTAVIENEIKWNSAYNRIQISASTWDQAVSALNSNKDDWSWAYNTIHTSKTAWDQAASDLNNSSSDWDFAYRSVLSGASDWTSTYNIVQDKHDDWDDTHDIVTSKESEWDFAYNTLVSNNSKWTSVATQVDTNSNHWDQTYTIVTANSSLWGETGADISSLAAKEHLWDQTYSIVIANSAHWSDQGTDISTILSKESDWDSTHNIVTAKYNDWDSAYNTLNTKSSVWDQTHSIVIANSAYWSQHTDVSDLYSIVIANSAHWSQHTDVSTLLAKESDWDSAYNTLNTRAGVWDQTHSIVIANSAYWSNSINELRDDVDIITTDLSDLTSIVSSNSSEWFSPPELTSIISSGSANWNQTYNLLQQDRPTNNTEYNSNTFVNVSGDMMTGELVVDNDISVHDNLKIFEGDILFGDGQMFHGVVHDPNSVESLSRQNVRDFKDVYSAVSTNSGDWFSPPELTSLIQTTYSTVTANSAHWGQNDNDITSIQNYLIASSGAWQSTYTLLNSTSSTNNPEYNQSTFVNVSGDTITGDLNIDANVNIHDDLNISAGSIIFGDEQYFHGVAHDPGSIEELTKQHVRDFKNIHLTVTSNSGDWFSPPELTQRVDSLYNTLSANSAQWEHNDTDIDIINTLLSSGSGDWDSVYSYVNSNSATNNASYNRTTFVNTSGDTITGPLSSQDNIHLLEGDIIFGDDDASHGHSHTPEDLEILNKSHVRSFKATYSTVNINSGNWFTPPGIITLLNSSSANWNYAYDAIVSGESDWNETHQRVDISGDHWDHAHTIVLTNSSNWSSTYNRVNTSGNNWDNTFNIVDSTADDWDHAYESIINNSASWIAATSWVSSESATNNTAYNQSTYINTSGDTIDWINVTGRHEANGDINVTTGDILFGDGDWDHSTYHHPERLERLTGRNVQEFKSTHTTLHTTSAEWSDALTAVQHNSGDWSSTHSSVYNTSSDWDSVYSFVNGDSATNNTDYNSTTFVNTSGDIITGDLNITGNISGTTATFTTISALSSFVDVIDIKVRELSGYDIIDGDLNVGGDVSAEHNLYITEGELIFGDNHLVHGHAHNPGEIEHLTKINVREFKSTHASVITTSGVWDSTHASVLATSSDWDSTYASVLATSSNWDSTHTSVLATSGDWDSTYASVLATSSDWDSTHASVLATSSDWDSTYASVLATSSDWDSTHASVLATSSNWESTHASVLATSSDWNSTHASVLATSSDWDSTHASVLATSSNWDSTHASVLATSSDWDSTYASVLATSSNWDSTHASVLATSSDWDSTHASVLATSSNWDSVYSFVNTDSATNNTDYNNTTFVNTSGDTITGDLNITGNITGTTATFTTISALSSFVDVIDIKVRELSGYDIIDGDLSVGGDVSAEHNLYITEGELIFGDDHLVHGHAHTPEEIEHLTKSNVREFKSAHASVLATSSDWDSTHASVLATSGDWSSTHTSVFTTSSDWDSTHISVLATSSDWNSTHASVLATSGDWNSTHASVLATSSDWDSTHASVLATSSDWDSTHASVLATSSNWDSVYSFVNTDSATNNTNYNNTTFVNTSGDTITGSLCITDDFDVEGNTRIKGDLIVDGDVWFTAGDQGGKVTINLGDNDTDNITFNADVDSNISPDKDLTYTLGTTASHWKTLHVQDVQATNEIVVENDLHVVHGDLIFGDGSYDHGHAHTPDDLEHLSKQDVRDLKSTHASVLETSGDWNSTHVSVFNTSSDWNSTHTSVHNTSAHWDSVYSFVNTDSATNNTDYNRTTFVNTSGDTIVGDLDITGTLTGTTAVFTTISALSSFVDVIDIKVRELSGYDIIDGDLSVDGDVSASDNLYITNGNIIFGDNHLVHGHAHTPEEIEHLTKDDVRNFKDTHASVLATSSVWNSTHASVLATSSVWDSTHTSVLETSGDWDSTHTSVLETSGDWDSTHTSVLETSGNWDSTHASVLATSGDWDSTHTSVLATSSDWDSTHASVLAASSDWDSTHASVLATSGNWDDVYSFVNGDSATNNTAYNRTTFVNTSGDTIAGDLSVTGQITGTTAYFTSITAISSVVDVIDIKVRELSGYDIIDGDLRVDGDTTVDRLLLGEDRDPLTEASGGYTSNLTSNIDCGVSNKYKYTHSVNVYGTGDIIVNGVTFHAMTSESNNNWSISNSTGVSNQTGTGDVTDTIGDVINDNYRYIVDTQTITLSGLTIGRKYAFTLYNQAWDTDNIPKRGLITRENDVTVAVDQNEFASTNDDGQIVEYVFTADDNTTTFQITPDHDSSWNIYAFTNREVWSYGSESLTSFDVTNFKSSYTSVYNTSSDWDSVYSFVNGDSATNNTNYNNTTFVNASGDTITGSLCITDELRVSGETTLSGDVVVDGWATFNSGVTADSNVYIKGDLRVDGNVWLLAGVGDVINVGETADDVIVFQAPVDSNISPFAASQHDLGSVEKPWKGVYADAIIIQDVTLTHDDFTSIKGAGGIVSTTSANWNDSYTHTTRLTGETELLAERVDTLYHYTINGFDNSIVSYEPTLDKYISEEHVPGSIQLGDTVVIAALNTAYLLTRNQGLSTNDWTPVRSKPSTLFYRTNLLDGGVVDSIDTTKHNTAKYTIEVEAGGEVMLTELSMIANQRGVQLIQNTNNYTTDEPFVEFEVNLNQQDNKCELLMREVANVNTMWNPGVLSSKSYTWLDADNVGKVILDSQQTFLRWENSGVTDLYMWARAGSEPEYVTQGAEMLNGRNVLKFSGNSDFIESEYHDGESRGKWNEDPVTWYLVFKPTGVDNFHDYLLWFEQSTGQDLAIVPGDNDEFYGKVWMKDNDVGNGPYPFTKSFSTSDLINQWNIFELELNPITKKTAIYLNGHLIQSGMDMNYEFLQTSEHMLRLHANWIGSQFTDGYLAEFLVLEDYQRIQTEGYLAHKWGLQGKLPEDHTYKSIPPQAPAVFKGKRINLF